MKAPNAAERRETRLLYFPPVSEPSAAKLVSSIVMYGVVVLLFFAVTVLYRRQGASMPRSAHA